jgi:hypothetical protein
MAPTASTVTMCMCMCMVSPHVLNIKLKTVKNIIELVGNFVRAADVVDALMTRPFEKEFFDEVLEDKIKQHMDMAVMLLWMGAPDGAMEALCRVRALLDPVFVDGLWLANRLLSPGKDIGTLGDLPELIQLEIMKIMYDRL